MTSTPDLYELQRRFGGEVRGGRLRAPGPGHSRHDRSLSVFIGDHGRPVVDTRSSKDNWRDCRDYLGIPVDRPLNAAERAEAARNRVEREAEERRRQDEARAFCERVWSASEPVENTLAAAYLASRGLVPGEDLKFHPSAPYGYRGSPGAPAMVALVRGAGGVPRALQVTHLRADGSKARRTTFGQITGGAVRLASAGRELAVAEGVETALSFAELHALPTWAALGTANLEVFIPPLSIERLYVAADADEAGMVAARALAERACRRCEVVIRAAPAGQDWNDVLRGVGT